MSEFAACRLYIVNEPPEGYKGDDWVKIDQPEVPDKPASGFTDWLEENDKGVTLGNIQEYFSQFNSMCSDDGSLRIELQVHRSRSDLEYTLITSYGVLEGPFLNDEVVNTTVDIEGASSFAIQKEISGDVDWSWHGDVIIGNSIAQISPEVLQQGQVLDFGDKEVTGTLHLKYTQSPDTYYLVLKPRPAEEYDVDDQEAAYAATVRAVWTGDPVSHKVDIPDIDEFCINSGTEAKVDPDDPDKPDPDKCYIRKLLLDPCNLEKKNDQLVESPCPEDDKENDG